MVFSKKWTLVKNDIPEYEGKAEEIFLIEDMFQASCNDYVIDSGWYGDENGRFITYLIKDKNWEEPLIKIVSFRIPEIKRAIEFCRDYADNLIKTNFTY